MQSPFQNVQNRVMFDFGNQMQKYVATNWFAIAFNFLAVFQIISTSSFQLFLLFWLLYLICILFGNLRFLESIHKVIDLYPSPKLIDFKKKLTNAFMGIVFVSLLYPSLFSIVFFSKRLTSSIFLDVILLLLLCWIVVSNFIQLATLSLNEWILDVVPRDQKWTNILILSIFKSSDGVKNGSRLLILPVLNILGLMVYQGAFSQLGESFKTYYQELDGKNLLSSEQKQYNGSCEIENNNPQYCEDELTSFTYFTQSPLNRSQIHLNFCPYCGEKLFPTANFCSNCGFKLEPLK